MGVYEPKENLMERAELSIDGMSCGHCVGRVKKALEGVSGVFVENAAVGKAHVSFDPAKTNRDEVADAVTKAGYAAKVVAPAEAAACAPTAKSAGGCSCCH